MQVEAVIGVFVKFLVLLTPFFILSVFVSVTDGMTKKSRKHLARKTTIAIWVISLVIYFFGNKLFTYMGLTIPAFQAGTGILLMLSGRQRRWQPIPAAVFCSAASVWSGAAAQRSCRKIPRISPWSRWRSPTPSDRGRWGHCW